MSAAAPVALPEWVNELDETIDRLWEPLRGRPAVDRVFYAASAVGDFSMIWHAVNVIGLVASPTTQRRFVRLAVGLAVESLIVNQGLKRMFRRTRPLEERARPHRLRQPSTTSFPSGHASSAAMAASLLGERSRLAPLTTTAAAVVATSRLHVRIHHASDVAAGAIVGVVLAAAWKRIWPLPR